jgi:hypothetical protein
MRKVIYKKNVLSAIILFVIIHTFGCDLNAKEYLIYVSLQGNDRNSGSLTEPLATLEGAKLRVREIKQIHLGENITVFLREGYHQLDQTFTIGLEDGGDGKSSITYSGYPDEKAIVGSGTKLNILKLASVDADSNKAMTLIPSTYPMRKVWEYRRINPNLWLENAIDFLDKPGEWVVDTHKRKIWYWPKNGKPGDDIRIPKLGTLIKVAGKTDIPRPIDIPVKGVVFKNLTFMHADRVLWDDEEKGIQHDWEMEDKENALIRFRGAENCKVVNCEFTQSGGNALRLDYYCQNIEITGNEINNLGQSAVMCIGYGPGTKDVNKNNRITNNHIHHCGQIYWHSQMIFLWQSGNNYVANNFIHDVPRKAVGIVGPRLGHFTSKTSSAPHEYWKTIRWEEVKETGRDHNFYLPFLHARNNLVENNEIRNPMFLLGDGAVVNISGAGIGNVVRHNLIYDMNNKLAASALRSDDSQTGSVFEDNIVFRSNITVPNPRVKTFIEITTLLILLLITRCLGPPFLVIRKAMQRLILMVSRSGATMFFIPTIQLPIASFMVQSGQDRNIKMYFGITTFFL